MKGENEDTRHSRRTVLQSAVRAGIGAGALLTAGAGAVQASSFEEGDCAVVDTSNDGTYVSDHCGPYNTVDFAENGSVGTVVDTCVSVHNIPWAFVDWSDDDVTDGWVRQSDLAHC